LKRVATLFIAFLFFPGSVRADEAADLSILKKAGVESEGAALLKFLGASVPKEGGDEEIAPLVKKMASEDFFEREAALKKVIALGPRAAPFLRQAIKDSDKELARRAEECLKIIEGGPGLDVHGATLRLIGMRKPEGAAKAILEYLPFAPNERIVEEAVAALGQTALEKGKTVPALAEALTDKFPTRRAAAVEILAKVDFESRRPQLVKMLADADPTVRYKAGTALALKHEKAAIPALIALLGKAPASQSARIESMLQKLAAYKGPSGAQPDLWQKWWTVNAERIDLATLTTIPKLLGKTLLVHSNTGKVQEVDAKGKVEWEVTGLQFPTAAQMLEGNRVAILENRLRRMTIRNIKGGILKTITISLPTDLQALPNSNIFVTSRVALIEYDKDGAQVQRIQLKGFQALSARKTLTGDIYCFASTGQIVKLDNTGKEIARFPVGRAILGGSFDVTPEGRVLLTDTSAGRVLEYDVAGKVQREWKIAGATSAVRLPNGNTLVVCGGAERVVEINDRGTVVWQHETKGSPVLRADKR